MENEQPSNQQPRTSPVVSSRPRTSSSTDIASWTRILGLAGQIGYLLAIPAVLFVIGGAWLDSYLGTKPVWTLVGIPVALTVSVMGVWRLVRQVQGENN